MDRTEWVVLILAILVGVYGVWGGVSAYRANKECVALGYAMGGTHGYQAWTMECVEKPAVVISLDSARGLQAKK